MRISVVRVLAQSIYSAGMKDSIFTDTIQHLLSALDSFSEVGTYHVIFNAKYLQEFIDKYPQGLERLQQLNDTKKIQCGPWYMFPNDCLANAESIVRNLYFGNKICHQLGNVLKVGYSGMVCNNNSQLPQIFNGFNIDTICIPISKSQHLPNKFYWEGVDGNRALVLSAFVIDTRKSEDLEQLGEILDKLETDDTIAGMPLLIISSVQSKNEHQQFQQIIENSKEKRDVQIEFTSLPDYFWGVKDATSGKFIRTLTQEVITDPKVAEGPPAVKCMRIRNRNSNVVQILQYYAEPWDVICQSLGGMGDEHAVQDCWQQLLTLQSAINDNTDFERFSKNMIRRQYIALSTQVERIYAKRTADIISKIKLPGDSPAPHFTVFNSLPYNRDKVIAYDLEIPSSLALEDIIIEDLSGRKLSSVTLSKSDVAPVFDQSENIPVSRYRGYLELRNFPAMGYKTFRIVPVQRSPASRRKNIISAKRTLENDFIRVALNNDGTFNVYSKETGITYKNLGYFIDTVQDDPDDPRNRRTINSKTLSPVIRELENSTLVGSYKIEYSWTPTKKSENNRINLTVVLKLDRLSRYVNFIIDLVDKALNHKIACYFPVQFRVGHLYSDIRFDIQDVSPCVNVNKLDRYYMSLDTLVGLCNDLAGYAIISREIRSACVTTRKHASVSLPIVDKISHQPAASKGNNTAILKYHLAFYPYIGGWENGQILFDAYNCVFAMKSCMTSAKNGDLPAQLEFLKISPANLCFSALKTSEKGNVIIRFFNPSLKYLDGSIKSYFPLISAKMISLEEYIIEDIELKNEHEVALLVPPKKIITIELRLRK